MKKTIMINLSGRVFHIDEDAYRLLDNYITNLRNCFSKQKGGDEIINDMESRISELFTENLQKKSSTVITIEDVDAIITTMGKPEDLNDSEDKYEEESKACDSDKGNVSKKLYRDVDDKILGGVASGVAAYFDWDVTLVRIAFILLGIFTQGFILIYIIGWIVIPAARTAQQKLSMCGKKVTLENIGKTVTDEMNQSTKENTNKSFLHKLGDAVVTIAGYFIKFILILLLICFIPIILAFFLIFLVLIAFGFGWIPQSFDGDLYNYFPMYNWGVMNVSSPFIIISMAICGILVIGIPIIALIHSLMRHYYSWLPMSKTTKTIFLILWIVALFFALILNKTYLVF